MLYNLKISSYIIGILALLNIEAAFAEKLNTQIVEPVKFFVDRDKEANKITYNLTPLKINAKIYFVEFAYQKFFISISLLYYIFIFIFIIKI